MIQIKNIKKKFGDHEILKGISLEVEKGDVVAILGPSGSGKTTLSKLLLHLYTPETGDILINGNNIEDIQLEYFWRHIFCWYDSFNDCRWWRIIGSIFLTGWLGETGFIGAVSVGALTIFWASIAIRFLTGETGETFESSFESD